MHRAQVGVGAVELVLVAVLLQRYRFAARIGTNPVGAGLVVGLGVDVVAEVDDEIEVILGHRGVRVVVAEGVVLAGEEGEADLLVGVGRQCGAEAANGTVLALSREAVVVLRVRLQALDLRLYREVGGRDRGDLLLRDDLAEALVGCDFERHRDLSGDVVQARPERHSSRGRVACDDALSEGAASGGGEGARVDAGCKRLRGDDQCSAGYTSAAKEVTTGCVRHNEPLRRLTYRQVSTILRA